jgi:cell division septal protein FtsQ
MTTKGKKKKSAKKRKRKSRKQNRSFFMMLRQWSLPLFLLLLISFSLAATFYLVFLHTPATPLF